MNKPQLRVVGADDNPRGPTHNGGNDGGGGGDVLESRVARLEAHTEHIMDGVRDLKAEMRDFRQDARRDFYIQWAGLVAVALGLAGLMAKGFGWL